MKDIRRQVERQTGRREQRARPAPESAAQTRRRRCPSIAATAATPRAAGLAAVRQVVADYVELTKPKVQSLLLLTTVDDDGRRRRPVGRRSSC